MPDYLPSWRDRFIVQLLEWCSVEGFFSLSAVRPALLIASAVGKSGFLLQLVLQIWSLGNCRLNFGRLEVIVFSD